MTQSQLAERVGLKTSTISSFERGEAKPSLDKAIDIAQVFGKPVEEVFQLVEVPA